MTKIVKAQSAELAYSNNEEVAQIAQIVQKVAPWARDMQPQEIGLSVRRAMSMGVDPLNPHEIQIWKDFRGTINVQLAYPLVTEWVRRFKGDHTRPIYYRLLDEQLEEEGLKPGDVAYRVEFTMTADLHNVLECAEVFGKGEARKMFAVVGLGVATEAEWNRKTKKGADIFAPAGRSKAWKVQKRALTDAYRCRFGTPTRTEIEELRRGSVIAPQETPTPRDSKPKPRLYKTRPSDWKGAEGLAPGDAHALATERATRRENPTSEADVQDAKVALFTPPPPPEFDVEADAANITELQQEAEHVAAQRPSVFAIGKALRRDSGWTTEAGKWKRGGGTTLGNDKLGNQVAAIIGAALKDVPGVDSDKPHHAVLNWLFEVHSTKALTITEGRAIVTCWGGGERGWNANPDAIRDVRAIFAEIQDTAG